MTHPESLDRYATVRIEPDDAASGFSCGRHPLDDYFRRHAVANDRSGISRAYVLRRGDSDPPELPDVLGFYTLSMALAESTSVAKVLDAKLPRYPMPVALIGRLAIDTRAQGRRLGETCSWMRCGGSSTPRVSSAASASSSTRRTRAPSVSTRSTTSSR
jgi:hypothetical protein